MTREGLDVAQLLGHTCPPGPTDDVCDVPGVLVGHQTLHDDGVHSGVTALRLDPLDRPGARVPAGLFVGNGHGKFIGATQLVEFGCIETPLVLTSTLSAFAAADALVRWVLRRPGNEQVITLNPVVGECNDGSLSDIRAMAIRPEHVWAALDAASTGPTLEGNVGAGTGMRCMGFKGGIGTASRTCRIGESRFVVGVLCLSNFPGRLVVGREHVPVPTDPDDRDSGGMEGGMESERGNSCVLVAVTDAPLDSRQLTRVARRLVYAMGGIGARFSNGSGDYGLALGVGTGPVLADAALDPLFDAAREAAETAILHSLWAAETLVGFRGHRAVGLRSVWEPAR